jgi:hypothetical protein
MENIMENNKLIAEFMGYEIQKDPTERFFGRYKSLIGAWHKEIDLAFHHDWNWLIEVVKKIEKTTIRETHGQFNENECEATISISIENTFCQILSNGAFLNEIISINGESKIEAVYSACVEFVKWYNENK